MRKADESEEDEGSLSDESSDIDEEVEEDDEEELELLGDSSRETPVGCMAGMGALIGASAGSSLLQAAGLKQFGRAGASARSKPPRLRRHLRAGLSTVSLTRT